MALCLQPQSLRSRSVSTILFLIAGAVFVAVAIMINVGPLENKRMFLVNSVEASNLANTNTCSEGKVVRCLFTASDTVEAVYLGNELMNSRIINFDTRKSQWEQTKVLDFCEPTSDTSITFLTSQYGIAPSSTAPRCLEGNKCDEQVHTESVDGDQDSTERPGFQLWCRSSEDESEWNMITNDEHWNTFTYNSAWVNNLEDAVNLQPDSIESETYFDEWVTTRPGPMFGDANVRISKWFQTWWRDFFITLRNYGGESDNAMPEKLHLTGNGPYVKSIAKIWGEVDESQITHLGFQTEVKVEQTTALKEIIPNVCDHEPDFPYYFSGRCYLASWKNGAGGSQKWSDASSVCDGHGSTLVSILSTEENWFVFNRLGCSLSDYNDGLGSNCGCKSASASGAGSSVNCWIGLVQVQNGVFGWLDGSEYSVENVFWSAMEPNDLSRGGEGEDCVHMWDRGGYSSSGRGFSGDPLPEGRRGLWNDQPCTSNFHFVCTKLARCPLGYRLLYSYTGQDEPNYDPGKCRECEAGRYRDSSISQSDSCQPCNAGRTGNPGATTATCDGPCKAGHYCPAGTAVGEEIPCPAGTFGTKTDGISETDACTTCRPGKYCDLGATEELDCQGGYCGFSGEGEATCNGKCPAGYYCPEPDEVGRGGSACPNADWEYSNIDEAFECGGNQFYCPEGATVPEDVDTGYYSTGGTASTREAQQLCDPGHYCQDGVRYPCPPGTYNGNSGEVSDTACLECPAGYFCGEATVSSTQNICGSGAQPEKYYCPPGSEAPLEVDEGHYTTPRDTTAARTREGQLPCNTDEICIDGLKFPVLTMITSCPAEIHVPEMSQVGEMGLQLEAQLNQNLSRDDFEISYRLAERASGYTYDFHQSPAPDGCAPKDDEQRNGGGLFTVNEASGEMVLTRLFQTDPQVPRDEDVSLNYEVCLPELDIRYAMVVNVTAEQIAGEGNKFAEILCDVTVIVDDRNDEPYFEKDEIIRVIDEKADRNTPVRTCTPGDDEEIQGCSNNEDSDSDDAEVEAFDEDVGSVLRYSLVPGDLDHPEDPDDQIFKIDDCSGLITMARDMAVNFSDPAIPKVGDGDGEPAFRLRVKVTDDGNGGRFDELSSTQILTVFIRNVNDPPVLVDRAYAVTELEPAGTEVIPAEIIAYDEDGDAITFRVRDNRNGDAFEVRDGTNILQTSGSGAESIDFETNANLNIEIEARDADNALDRRVYSVDVLDSNDPPVFQDVPSSGRYRFFVAESCSDCPVCRTSVSESSGECTPGPAHAVITEDKDAAANTDPPDDTTTYSLSNGDDYFSIDETTGQISTRADPLGGLFDFEADERLADVPLRTGRSIKIEINATSSGDGVTDPPIPRSQLIEGEVYIVDVNEAPGFPEASPSLPMLRVLESAPRDSRVPMDGALADKFKAQDPDNNLLVIKGQQVPPQKLTYSLTNLSPGNEALDGETLFNVHTTQDERLEISVARDLSFADAPTEADGCPSATRCYVIRVRVSDNGFPIKSSEEDITIEIVNTNSPPAFDDDLSSTPLEVPEDVDMSTTLAPVNVSGPLSATDPDPDDILTYQLVQGDSRFAVENIGNNEFIVQRKEGASLNFEDTVNSFDIVVRASDRGPNKEIGTGCSEGDSCGGDGAFCQLNDGRCYETCVDTTTGTDGLTVQNRDPYLWFFCDYDGEEPVTLFPETAEIVLTINVLDRNDPPRFIIDGAQKAGLNGDCELTGSVAFNNQDETQILFADITVEDEDDQLPSVDFNGAPFTFAEGPVDAAFWDTFVLADTSNGKVESIATEDLVAFGHVFNGSITVSDSNDVVGTSSCLIRVTVVEENTRPDLGPDLQVTLPESTTAGSTIVEEFKNSLGDIDPDVDCCDDVLTFSIPSTSQTFNINSASGRVSLGQRGLDFEANSEVSALVRVRDAAEASDTALVTVTVEDVNEAPFWPFGSLTEFEVAEDAEANVPVGIPFDDIAKDPDVLAYTHGKPQWNSLEFTLVNCDGTESCPFVLNDNKTQLLVSESASFDFEQGTRSWTFGVIASDLADTTPLSSSERQFTVNLLPVPSPPRFLDENPVIIITENDDNDASKDLFSMSELVFDPDTNDTIDALRFTIEGFDGPTFFVEQGWLRADSPLDYEEAQEYTLFITVNDTTGLTVASEVNVTIQNVDDVSISSVSLASASESESSELLLSCDGGDVVVINGTNFGLINQDPVAEVSVTYEFETNTDDSSVLYEASDCAVASGDNKQIECTTTRGVGRNLKWHVSIVVPDTSINGDGAMKATDLSFARPEIQSVNFLSPSEDGIPTIGGSEVELSGKCLGAPEDELVIAESQVADNQRDSWVEYCSSVECYYPSCTHQTVNTLRCTTLPGIGDTIRWHARIARRRTLSSFSAGAYLRPYLASISELVLPTRGNLAFKIMGGNFGPEGSSPSVAKATNNFTHAFTGEEGQTISYNLLGCSVTSSDRNELSCSGIEPGIGVNLEITVEFGNQQNDVAADGLVVSFEPPTFEEISGEGAQIATTAGGQPVDLIGDSFGPRCGLPGSETGDGRACGLVFAQYTRNSIRQSDGEEIIYYPPCAVASQTRIICTTVPGTGTDLKWTVQVGSQSLTVPWPEFSTSYGRPSVGGYEGGDDDVNTDSLDTRGGEVVRLSGSNFGPVDGAAITATYSSEEFDGPVYTAQDCSVSIPHLEVTCTTTEGVGEELSWVVIVDGQESVGQLTNYGLPEIDSITLFRADGSPADIDRMSDDGGETVVLHGKNFGPNGEGEFEEGLGPYLELVSYGPEEANQNYELDQNDCVVVSHSEIECTTMPGVGSSMQWFARVKSQTGNPSVVTTSYVPPEILNVSPLKAETNGGITVTVRGTGFGLCDPLSSTSVLLGDRSVSISKLIDESGNAVSVPDDCPLQGIERELEFSLPELVDSDSYEGETLGIIVSSQRFPEGNEILVEYTEPFIYEAPQIDSIFAEPSRSNQPGDISVSILGKNFCASEDCCTTYLNDNPIPSTFRRSHSHGLIRIFSEDVGTIQIKCGSVQSSKVEFTSFSPSVLGTIPRLDEIEFETVGGDLLEVWGSSFGTSAPNVTFGDLDSNQLLEAEVESHEQLDSCSTSDAPSTMREVSLSSDVICFKTVVKVPEGEGKELPLVVRTGAQPSNPEDERYEFLSYKPPLILKIDGDGINERNPTSGGTNEFEIEGDNFGRAGFGVVHIGDFGLTCEVLSWNHASITCLAPPGEGELLPIQVENGGQSTDPFTDDTLSYFPPVITDWTLEGEFTTQGGENLTLTGQHFGRPLVPTITIGDRECELLESWFEGAVCLTPEGEGMNHAVTITVRGQSASASTLFSYAKPKLEAIFPDLVPTSGWTGGSTGEGERVEVELFGENFGVNLLRVLMNGRNVKDRNEPFRNEFLFANHTYARFLVPPFFGAEREVKVRVDGQESNSVLLSYRKPSTSAVTMVNEEGQERVFSTSSTIEQNRLPRSAFASPSDSAAAAAASQHGRIRRRQRQRRLASGEASGIVDNDDERELRRHLAGNVPQNGYGNWTSDGFGACEGDSANRDWFWRTSTEISETGEYVKRQRAYSDFTCSEEEIAFELRIVGTVEDLGNSNAFPCGRVYSDETENVFITPFTTSVAGRFSLDCPCELELEVERLVSDCLPCESMIDSILTEPNSLGYGMYLISERSDLYMSMPIFDSVDAVDSSAAFRLPDFPTASVEAPELVDVPQGPTDGCWKWEPMFEYQERVRESAASSGISSIPRKCERPAVLSLTGDDFGSGVLAEEGDLRVWLRNPETGQSFEAATTSSKGNHAEKCSEEFCEHTHNKLTFQVPFGNGNDLDIFVQVGNQNETVEGLTFSYLPPALIEVVPGSLWNRRDFINAEGSRIEVRGRNFGSSLSDAGIIVNGRVCQNTEWQPGDNDEDGFPFIECDTARDVAGPKSLVLCVAEQTSVDRVERDDASVLLAGDLEGVWADGVSKQGFDSEIRSFGVARCMPGDSGRMYELCRECPTGATCEGNFSFATPQAAETFFHLEIPVFVPDSDSDSDSDSDAPLVLNSRAEARCAPEQWNATLLNEFPDLVLRETCDDFTRCIPPNACASSNECTTGYRYAYDRCVDARSEFSDEENSCSITRNPYTGEFNGNHADCTGQTEPGNACPSGRPWECARCEVTFPSGNASEPVGVCQCSMPTRCALCTIGTHFRMHGECEKCPDSPELLIAGFFLLAIAVAYGGYQLQKRQFNLAFITIGVDYFQVLAIFSTLNVEWPPELMELYNVFSVFNFNIDITAPECLVPNFEYETKWWMTESLPIAVAAILVMVYVGYLAFKCIHQGTQANHKSHVARLVAIGLISFYYLYLSVTSRALDVFDCNPVDPDDGNTYTSFTSLSCDGGSLCRCNEPGGIQQRLAPLAIFFLIVYSGGFPLFVFVTWWRHRQEIMEDQYLRALDLGETRDENPHAYDLRKKYSKLYYHFVPQKTYWLLLIIFRKFGIAVCALLLRDSPSFQLSVIVLILFVSLVAHVVNKPFMSTSERPDVVRDLEERASRASEEPEFAFYANMLSNVQRSMKQHTERQRKEKERTYGKPAAGGLWDKRKSFMDVQSAARRKPRNMQAKAVEYLANYNTVEMVLLSSGILVATAGVMFASGRFEERDDIRNQEQTVTWLTLLVVVLSILYYLAVFVAEFAPKFAWRVAERCRGKQADKRQEEFQEDVQLESNPMFHNSGPEFGDTSELDAQVQASMAELRAEELKNQQLRKQMAEKKKKQQESTLVEQSASVQAPQRGITRKQFGQTRTYADSSDE